MKVRKILSALLGICMMLSILLVPTEIVSATTTQNDAVLEARKGIVQVMYAAENADGDVVDIYGGTGFLIGVEESGAEYVITNHHVVEPFHAEYTNVDLEKQAVWDFLGVPYDQEIKVVIRVVLKRDTYIEAEIIESSMSTDFAILKLEQPIYGDRKPLPLADSSQLKETEDVYALGFPSIVQAMQDAQLYTSSDVNINDGKVSKLAESVLIDDPIPCINHSATITSGNSGGPLVNANGEVVGVNRHTDVTGTYFYSVQINEISEVLDLRGIAYEKSGGVSTSEPAEETVAVPEDTQIADAPEATEQTDVAEDNTALFDELAELIDEAEAIDLTVMTEESVLNFEDALENAKDVYDDANASKEDLEDAMDELDTAQKGLVEAEKGLSPVLLIAIIAVVLIIVVVVIVVIVVSSNKKKQAAAEKERQRRAAMSMNQKPLVNTAPMGYQQPRPPVAPMMNDGSDETGVLNDGSSETTVLGGGQSVPTAYLVRKKNNERITISKQVFKLGKERRKVDYCIADNTSVSRTHADIVYKNGEFYIVDNNATNGTSVNGASLAAGQERVIKSNDIIKLADEEFQFRTF